MPIQENQPGRAKQKLATEYATFTAHKEELLKTALGKWALVHGEEILGTFDTQLDCANAGYLALGISRPFLVKRVEPYEEPIAIYSASEQHTSPGTIFLRATPAPIAG